MQTLYSQSNPSAPPGLPVLREGSITVHPDLPLSFAFISAWVLQRYKACMSALILPSSPEISYILPEQEGKSKGFQSIEGPGVRLSRRYPKRKVDFFLILLLELKRFVFHEVSL